MRLTEAEARKTWCPFARKAEIVHFIGPSAGSQWQDVPVATSTDAKCIATDCMAWRWINNDPADAARGYCGLAGRP